MNCQHPALRTAALGKITLLSCLLLLTTSTRIAYGDEGFNPSSPRSRDLSSGHNCQREKTLGTLPAGAPLPDIQIPQNDTITAEQAYKTAKKFLTSNCQIDATEYFERAIDALRKKRGTNSKKLVETIVTDYGRLLRAHLGTRKATELEKEFLSE
jgi:hypothetical protein